MNIEELVHDPNAAIEDLLSAPTPITWRIDPDDPQRTLSAHDAEVAWEQLRAWVDWLVERYALDHKCIPPCWYLHGAVVDELTALWGAWQIAYWPLGSAADPANWMAIFANTRFRLTEWNGRRGCRPDDHRPDRVLNQAVNQSTWKHTCQLDLDLRP